MKLTIRERLVLQNMLPKEGNFMTLRLMRVLREDLSFNDEEIKEANFRQEGNQLMWDDKAKIVKEIEVGETMNALIVKTLKELDETQKLTEEQITLYEKFVEKTQAPKLEAVPDDVA